MKPKERTKFLKEREVYLKERNRIREEYQAIYKEIKKLKPSDEAKIRRLEEELSAQRKRLEKIGEIACEYLSPYIDELSKLIEEVQRKGEVTVSWEDIRQRVTEERFRLR